MNDLSTTPPHGAEPETPAGEIESLIVQAVEAAPLWAAHTPQARAAVLVAVADALEANSEHLVAIADRETGLGVARLSGEVKRTAGQLRGYGAYAASGAPFGVTIDHADPAAAPPRPELRRHQVPLGPVEVFAGGNFPFAFSVAGTDTAAALAAGCPVLLKAHPGHPRTSATTAALVREALAAAGAPLGTFALFTGREAGVAVLRDPRVRAAAFTGSVRGGRALFDIAAARPVPIPFFGELGSVNPVVVTPAALAERRAEIAAGFAGSFTLGAGQFCTKPGILLLPRDPLAVEEIAAQVRPGAAAAMLSAPIAEGYRRRLDEVTRATGTRTLVEGTLTTDGDGRPQASPTLFSVASAEEFLREADNLLEECFGPSALLVQYDPPDEAARLLDRLEGSLTVTFHTGEGDGETLAPLVHLAQQKAGRVLFNGWPTGVAVTRAQQHGGPYPAATSPHTSVGAYAVERFLRPVAYQDAPPELLPAALREDNPLQLVRTVDGKTEGA
ncbi:aldehyde dehydrogenase family protein [Streptomyces sp. LHD-70]|uniref:aldehyde dehydrogenase family protein n=1 Tax=Streptomyces sp. LHD-70 TaxID=3072140 RepID=UPI00280E189F|nr:aldehyde dehydrogenase family protein [Streptomyces sp. LHD-70]MDQ8702367.1 aldehyde dehydrogenase family protein [Streptomyces sp. LHD-70]